MFSNQIVLNLISVCLSINFLCLTGQYQKISAVFHYYYYYSETVHIQLCEALLKLPCGSRCLSLVLMIRKCCLYEPQYIFKTSCRRGMESTSGMKTLADLIRLASSFEETEWSKMYCHFEVPKRQWGGKCGKWNKSREHFWALKH